MKTIRQNIIFLAVGLVLGCIIGALTTKAVYNRPVAETSVKRDTVTLHDTIPDHSPTPKDSTPVKTVVRWLPLAVPKVVHDTIDNVVTEIDFLHTTDTVAIPVEVPITSKHYHGVNYDAYVSGFEPSLDSINVYSKTQVITETVTVTKKSRTKRWGIGLTGGWGYDFNSKTAAPYVGVGVSYNFVTF